MKKTTVDLKSLGMFISKILRHEPELVGIKLDKQAYANVDELIKGVNQAGTPLTFDILRKLVETNNKQRYSFNEDFTKIRANQGHSIKGLDLGLQYKEPPEYLYHGTAEKSLESIFEIGINKRKRHDVHLSDNIETARQVGSRHGKPVVLRVRAKDMHKANFKFALSDNGVWLTKFVPVSFIEII